MKLCKYNIFLRVKCYCKVLLLFFTSTKLAEETPFLPNPFFYILSTHISPPSLCLCKKASSLMRFDTDGMFFPATLIWYHAHTYTHTHTHTQSWRRSQKPDTPIWIHINFTYYVLTAGMFYIKSIICWYQKITLKCSTMSLLLKNYSLVEVTYLLIGFNKTKFFQLNKKNTDRNGVNKQITRSHTSHSVKDYIGKR